MGRETMKKLLQWKITPKQAYSINPQHPCKPPMTHVTLWRQKLYAFVLQMQNCNSSVSNTVRKSSSLMGVF